VEFFKIYIKEDSGGGVPNNVGGGRISNQLEFIKDYKFNFFENESEH
jgi:hypothetical protein